ncbi:MAG: ATP cone domain-containing protein [bacterium]|nr:ATP cone domain-containing protein [bacterium]
MKHIIKRHGHEETYDGRKIYASVYAAGINSHHEKEEAEKMADVVCDSVSEWVSDKSEVSSNDLFKIVTEELRKMDKDAAFMYETHRDLS